MFFLLGHKYRKSIFNKIEKTSCGATCCRVETHLKCAFWWSKKASEDAVTKVLSQEKLLCKVRRFLNLSTERKESQCLMLGECCHGEVATLKKLIILIVIKTYFNKIGKFILEKWISLIMFNVDFNLHVFQITRISLIRYYSNITINSLFVYRVHISMQWG